jgi:two-component system, chemotaxis family, CheB/CheR fusion protein
LNSTDIGTLFLDSELKIRKFTPAVRRIFNLEESDIGRSIESFASDFSEETRKSIIQDSKTALDKLKSFEKEIQDSNGNWYLKRINPFITLEKKIEGVVITFVDINNFKKAKQELSDSELRLTSALEAGKMAWWEMKLPSGEVKFSKNKTQMLGLKAEDFKHYKDFMKIVHPDDYDAAMNAMKAHISGETDAYECFYRMKNSNGKYQWFQDIGRIANNTGNEMILSGIVLEITTKKETEIELLKAMKKAETANIYKNQFLANMSHELRTPLNGLLGFATMLRKKNLDDKTKNSYIDIIESSSEQLLNLINDIIDIAKIEAGELKIEVQTCNLDTLLLEIESTFNELKSKLGKEDVILHNTSASFSKTTMIKTDPNRLKQVLGNILNNAIKFTEKGEVKFGYEISDGKILFKVSDTGIGISRDNLDAIFERFHQIESPNKNNFDGTGLGLAICKGILHLLGGSIRVESELGKGSIFKFDIPYIPDNLKSNKTKKDKDVDFTIFEGKTVLIAEDDEINQLFTKELLKEVPLSVLWANNGKEAVEIFQNHQNISIVLMDIRMPIMDGYKAAEKILLHNPKARIIAHTAYAMPGDKENIIQKGFVDYIAKPIQRELLMEILVKWIK